MQTKKVLFTAIAFMALSFTANAQNNRDPKIYVVHTMYVNRTGETLKIRVDSLLKIFKETAMDANPYFTSSKIVAHLWGHDSREVLMIYELKSMNDLEAAFEKQNSLFMTYIKAHKDFGDQWLKIFLNPEHHSDEIYGVVAE
jgi:hypothetical protein